MSSLQETRSADTETSPLHEQCSTSFVATEPIKPFYLKQIEIGQVMSKIEKTLELNITHEILSLADSFWWFLQPVSLKRYWRPHWRFPLMQPPRSFATGLHINLEGKKGGGYDVCINSPSNFQGGNPRLLFMQFKAGIEKSFNSNPSSIFYGDSNNPNIHVEFDINNNEKRNQHALLKTLALKAGNKDAVVYVFPRIVNETQLTQNIGKLLGKTTFLSIDDIDTKAAANKIKIDDGNPHKFRTCYRDWSRNEINLLLVLLGKINDPGKYLGEIFSIRMYRGLQSLKKVQVEKYPISKYHIMDAMIRHILNLGIHFSISLADISQYLAKYSQFSERFYFIYEFEDFTKAYQIDETENRFVKEIFDDILKSLSQYFYWIEEIRSFEDSKIPQPPSDFTIELTENGIRFELEFENEENIITPKDFDEITYSLF